MIEKRGRLDVHLWILFTERKKTISRKRAFERLASNFGHCRLNHLLSAAVDFFSPLDFAELFLDESG